MRSRCWESSPPATGASERKRFPAKTQVCRCAQSGHSTSHETDRGVQGSGRTVCGDSAFSSVACAVACRAVGLDYMGIVKSATKMYPRQYLLEAHYDGRGDQCVLQGIAEGVNLTALGWKDKTVQTLIFTRASIPEEHVSTREEWVGPGESATVVLRCDIPRMLREYYAAANSVDIANQMRQGILSIEENSNTEVELSHLLHVTGYGGQRRVVQLELHA